MTTNESQQILLQFRNVFRRRKAIVAACVAGVLLPVLVYNQLASPVYEASTALVFDEFTGPMPTFASDYSQEILTSNRVQELSSRSFAVEIAAALSPDSRARFVLPEDRPPDFDENEWVADRIHGSLDAAAVRKSSLVRVSVRLHDPQLAADVANIAAQVYQARNLRVQQEGVRGIRVFIEEQLARFRRQLDDSEEGLRHYKESQSISSFEGQEQEILRRVTEAEILFNAATTNREALMKRLQSIEESLAKTREELVPSVTEVASPRMQGLQERLVNLQLQYSELQIQNYPPTHPKMVQLDRDIAQTKTNLTAEAQRVAAGGDLVDPLQQISKYGDERLSLQIEIASVLAREEALRNVIRDYERVLSRLPEKEQRLAQLTRERDVNRRVYDGLLEKLEETKMSEAENLPGVRIVDVAEADPVPIRPRKSANLAIGLLLGLIGGTGIAFVRESTSASMESIKELEEMTGWPALATLPRISQLPAGGLGGVGDEGGDIRTLRARKRSLITLLEPGGGPAEAYRMLRTNLKFRGVGQRFRTILVTSTEPNEGKTTLVANLAICFATGGDRVLVLDAEVRRPGMHAIFGVPQVPGLGELLVGPAESRAPEPAAEAFSLARRVGAQLRAAAVETRRLQRPTRATIHPSSIPNLSVLPAGTSPDNPVDAIAGRAETLHDLLDTVRHDFDLVILDTPPLAIVHDTAILSRLVDGVVFVVNSRRIDRELLDRSRAILDRAGASVVGAVLNQVDPVGVYRKNAYYYRYRTETKGGSKV